MWIPFNWETETQVKGVGSDIASKFFFLQKVELELIVLGSWARCLKFVETGEIDIAIAAYKTKARERFGIYVAEEIGFDAMKIYIRDGENIQFNSFNDLKQYRGGGVRGDSYGEKFDTFKLSLSERQWTEVNSAQQNVGKLILQRVDYIPMNPWNLEVIMLKLKQQGVYHGDTKLVSVGEPIDHNGLYYLFSKKSDKYKVYGEELANYLKKLKSSGEIDEIFERNFKDYKFSLTRSYENSNR